MLSLLSLRTSKLCETETNAFAKSRKTQSVSQPLSTFFNTSLVKEGNCVSQDRYFLKPFWQLLKKELASKTRLDGNLKYARNLLQGILVIDIGW